MAALGIPVWILLLWLLPLSGMGPLPCLTLATALTAGVVVLAERRRARRLRDDGDADAPTGPRGRRGPMSAPAAAWETAVLARTAFAASLSTSPVSVRGPQWPCPV